MDLEEAKKKARERIALIALVIAKMSGMGGIGGMYAGYPRVGGTLLIMDAVMLVLCVILCLKNMRAVAVEERSDKVLIERMVREGTIKQYLREAGY